MTKILLVEDDKSLREIYGVRLLAEGYDIVSAGDGEQALAMAIKEKPTLIISDVMMPKISGFDMLDILRSTTETRDIKVIMMTALSSDDQRSRGEQLGADRYLVKSQVGIEDVVRTVHEVLEDTAAAPAAAPAAPSATPAVASDAAADTTPAAVPTADPTQLADDAASSVVASAAPGNDGAGPLPPQPEIAESTLPQPTAPFTSPRPTNLGERVIQPLSETDDTPAVTAEEIARELQAPADPVTSQVDEAITDADVADSTVPANDPAPAQPTDLSAPTEPSAPVDIQAPVAPAPAEPQLDTNADQYAQPAPVEPQQADEQSPQQPVQPQTPVQPQQ